MKETKAISRYDAPVKRIAWLSRRIAMFAACWPLTVGVALAVPASVDLESQVEPPAPPGAGRATDAWDFLPDVDHYGAEALLDLRSLNEQQSGQTGFIRLSPDGSSLVRGDGEPIRFWAVGSEVYHRPNGASGSEWQEHAQRHCRFLAKRGVNMVRLHLRVADTNEGADIREINTETLEGVFRFVKAAKDNGIYLTISPYYANHRTPSSWKLDGYSDSNEEPWGAIFIDERLQQAYREWTRHLYTTTNPYTGLAICDDPTVAVLQVHNEDSVFFWTFGDLPPAQQQKVGRLFGRWLEKTYGSIERASSRWPRISAPFDDLDNGIVGLLGPYAQTREQGDERDARIKDEVTFLAHLQRDFYADMGAFLRDELNCKQLLNASNWRTANDDRLKALERWTYAVLDIDAENEYFGLDDQHVGQHNGYRIDAGHYLRNRSCLFSPFELTCNFKSQVGHPFFVTETSWKHPNLYQAEGPFLTALYQSIGGVDTVFWFTANTPGWCVDPRREIWRTGDSLAHFKWSCSTPMLMGMFPAAAIVYRNGYIDEVGPVVHEERTLESLFNREPPALDDNEVYSPNWEQEEFSEVKLADGSISRTAFLVGPVSQVLGSPDAKVDVTDFSSSLDAEAGIISSLNRQARWNHREGYCVMDAEKAQGVVGFLQAAGGDFELSDVAIASQSEYAAISVVALDQLPLRASSNLLIQVGTTCRLSGWETEPAEYQVKSRTVEGNRIVATGKPPWQIESCPASITIENPTLAHAVALDVNGYMVQPVPLTRSATSVSLRLPRDAMYIVVRGNSDTLQSSHRVPALREETMSDVQRASIE